MITDHLMTRGPRFNYPGTTPGDVAESTALATLKGGPAPRMLFFHLTGVDATPICNEVLASAKAQ
jgi:hypothetical protein